MRYFLLGLALFLSVFVLAQNFNDHFDNKTLRLDYIFSGSSEGENVALNKLRVIDDWVGKRNNLSNLLLQGNGQLIVTEEKSDKIIYKEAFSSLFQEWQSTGEAKDLVRSFENVFLIPFPKEKVLIQVLFRQREGNYKEVLKHKLDPKDILISSADSQADYSVIHQGGGVHKSVNIALIPEGFTVEEMDKFHEYAKIAVEAILDHQPFGELKGKLNFFALNAPSKDSGVSIPREGVWKETLVHSHFDTFYSARYLTTSNLFDLHDALAGVPYSHIIILANTDTYGGGGIFNSYTLTTTGHKDFKPVVVHEFGHSFVGLGDEYFYEGEGTFDSMYPLDVEPWEPNITTLTDFSSKWERLLPQGTPIPTSPSSKYENEEAIGVFEGGGYVFKGIYRPAIDCRMRTNTYKGFCPACQDAIKQIITFYTE